VTSTPARRPLSVLNALTRALKAVQTGPEHAPTVALAKRFAAALDDDPGQLGRLGRPFLAVLVELRMTPKARAGVMIGDPLDDDPALPLPEGGGNGDGNSRDEVSQQRARRDRRQHHTAAMD
jgi:hypothetical protein